MPLIKVTLKDAIWSITEPRLFGKEYPANKIEAVVRWSECFEEYTRTIIPSTTTLQAAIGAFRGIFITYSLEAQDALLKLSAAVHAFAAALAPGMAAGGFIATPPPIPPDFVPVYIFGVGGGSGKECAEMIADIADAYFRTGTAVPAGGGPVVPWS
jgi:hypothetical protein